MMVTRRDERTQVRNNRRAREHDAELQRCCRKFLDMEPDGRGMSHWAGPA